MHWGKIHCMLFAALRQVSSVLVLRVLNLNESVPVL